MYFQINFNLTPKPKQEKVVAEAGEMTDDSVGVAGNRAGAVVKELVD